MGDKYVNFFKDNQNERVMVLQGGRRSRKTVNTYLYLYALSQLTKGKIHTTLTYSFDSLMKSISDFELVTGYKVQRHLNGYSYTDANKNTYLFQFADSIGKMLGNRTSTLFINEGSWLREDVADTALLGVQDFVIINLNPDRHNATEKYIKQNKENLLITTYRDNPYLSDLQLQSFKRLEDKAASPIASPLDIYNKTVFCDGLYCDIGGKIFTNVHLIDDAEYFSLNEPEFLGFDFGFVKGNDYNSLTGVKIHGNAIYTHNYLYDNEIETNEELAARLKEIGVDGYRDIYADYGGMGKQRMNDLIVNHGFSMQNAVKLNLMDRYSMVLNYSGGIYITASSKAGIQELNNYELDNGKFKGVDHFIDSFCYAVTVADRNK